MSVSGKSGLLIDLLVEEATQGLSPSQEAELELLMQEETSGRQLRDEYQLAAAAADLAFGLETGGRSVPPTLRPRLDSRLRRLAKKFSSAGAGGLTDAEEAADSTRVRALRRILRRASGGRPAALWLAAAALLLALIGWWPRFWGAGDRSGPVVEERTRRPEELLATGAVRVSLFPAGDPAAIGARGEALWSDRIQAGVLQISGLEVNDPQQFQYQLWVFDQDRDDRFPVDGGVFDFPDSVTTVTIPIDARLPLRKPSLFVITAERPGGVVVSNRERIILSGSS